MSVSAERSSNLKASQMPQTQFQRVTDLSRLNWRGWLLLLISIAVMLYCIIFVGMNPGTNGGYGGYGDDRATRKILGVVFGFATFGAFILIAVGLRKAGISIWKEGMDPYADDGLAAAPRSTQVTSLGMLNDQEPKDGTMETTDVPEGSSEAFVKSDFIVDPTDLL